MFYRSHRLSVISNRSHCQGSGCYLFQTGVTSALVAEIMSNNSDGCCKERALKTMVCLLPLLPSCHMKGLLFQLYMPIRKPLRQFDTIVKCGHEEDIFSCNLPTETVYRATGHLPAKYKLFRMYDDQESNQSIFHHL